MKLRKPRALCIVPPVYDFALYDLFLKPYGLLRIAALLEDLGFEVRMINSLRYRDPESEKLLPKPKRKKNGTGKFFRQEARFPINQKKYQIRVERNFARYGIDQKVFENEVAGTDPDIVFMSSGMTYWYPGIKEAAEIVRRIHPSVPVIIGGIYAALMEEHCREEIAPDYCISQFSLPMLQELLEGLGLLIKDRPMPDLLPGPLFSAECWGDAGVLRLNEGCPYRCEYCASAKITERFIPGDPEKGFEDLRSLSAMGIRNFAFYDDALLVNKEKILVPFLEKIIRSGIDADFYVPNAVHIEMLDFDTAALMRKAGFQEMRLGFESSSLGFHEEYDGKFSPDTFGFTVEVLKRAGFRGRDIGVYILTGMPGQTFEAVEESVAFAAGFGVRIFLSEFSPVPGSSLWEECCRKSRYPLAEEPLYHNNTFFPMEWAGFSLQELKRIKKRVKELNKQLKES